MTHIGDPEREIEVIPLYDPVPQRETPEEAPLEPEKEPEPVPA